MEMKTVDPKRKSLPRSYSSCQIARKPHYNSQIPARNSRRLRDVNPRLAASCTETPVDCSLGTEAVHGAVLAVNRKACLHNDGRFFEPLPRARLFMNAVVLESVSKVFRHRP